MNAELHEFLLDVIRLVDVRTSVGDRLHARAIELLRTEKESAGAATPAPKGTRKARLSGR